MPKTANSSRAHHQGEPAHVLRDDLGQREDTGERHSPRYRSATVAASFVAVSLLVAGAASAVVAKPNQTPIAMAVQLQQEDPTSQTAPVAASVFTNVPTEVGSSAIKCDPDEGCAALITVTPHRPPLAADAVVEANAAVSPERGSSTHDGPSASDRAPKAQRPSTQGPRPSSQNSRPSSQDSRPSNHDPRPPARDNAHPDKKGDDGNRNPDQGDQSNPYWVDRGDPYWVDQGNDYWVDDKPSSEH